MRSPTAPEGCLGRAHAPLPTRPCHRRTPFFLSKAAGHSAPADARPSRRRLRPAVAAAPAADAAGPSTAAATEFEFACPICLTTHLSLRHRASGVTGGLACRRCARTFEASADFVDLTLGSGAPRREAPPQRRWGGTELFRNPLVSFSYERGWRQGFAWAGFPGADKEYELAMEYLTPAKGSIVVDLSCGSGLFARRFAASGAFAGVVAADYSESMLRQAAQYFREDAALDPGRYVLVRADAGRLPFQTGSVAGIHAGAALHCWPDPQDALAEISRVLAPGGVFVASTFLTFTAPLGQLVGDELLRPLSQVETATMTRSMRWWEEAELKDLCATAGLVGYRRTRSNRFIMLAASKPAPA